MLGRGPLSDLFSCWLGLTWPGQSFVQPSESQAVLERAIKECEGKRSWMGSYHGEWAVLADILGRIILVFSPIGCQPSGLILEAPSAFEATHTSLADAFVDVVGQKGERRSLLQPGRDVVQLKPSCVPLPLHCVSQASRKSFGSQGSTEVRALLIIGRSRLQWRDPEWFWASFTMEALSSCTRTLTLTY